MPDAWKFIHYQFRSSVASLMGFIINRFKAVPKWYSAGYSKLCAWIWMKHGDVHHCSCVPQWIQFSIVLSLGRVLSARPGSYLLREPFALTLRSSSLQALSTLTTYLDEASGCTPISGGVWGALGRCPRSIPLNMLWTYLISLSVVSVGYRTWDLVHPTPCSCRVLWEGLTPVFFFSFFVHFLKLKGLILTQGIRNSPAVWYFY